ncbi:hypothetical protein ACGRHY_29960 [Streptomyces sp. HK10]|uniref:hypothetical protein n=1 Tax=Streptomyces sp. HK10 TaxID=3373255 RepID=UPI003748AFA2
MARKMPRKVSDTVRKVAATLAVLVAVVVYATLPDMNRAALALVPAAVGGAVYVALRAGAASMWGALATRRAAPRR